VVSAPLGVFGDKMFYVAGSGIQVSVPPGVNLKLEPGSTVRISGERSSYFGEARIKTAAAADITVLGAGEPPLPHDVETGEIGE